MQISDTKGSWCEDSKSSFQVHLVSTGRDPRLLSNRKLSPGSAFRKDLWFKMKREDRSIKKNYMYISPLKAPRRLNVWDFWKLLGVTIFWVRFLVMWVDAIGTQDTCKTTVMVPVPLKPRLPGPEAAAACARRPFGDSGEAQAAGLHRALRHRLQQTFADTRGWVWMPHGSGCGSPGLWSPSGPAWPWAAGPFLPKIQAALCSPGAGRWVVSACLAPATWFLRDMRSAALPWPVWLGWPVGASGHRPPLRARFPPGSSQEATGRSLSLKIKGEKPKDLFLCHHFSFSSFFWNH